MKRSKMVEFMTARFDFYNRKYPGVPLDLIMLYVLKGMESAGMVPPPYNKNEGSDMPSNEVNEWEPEDEAK